MRETLSPADLQRPHGYQHIVAVSGGRTVFVAGQTPTDAEGNTLGGSSVSEQTAEALRNLERAIAAAGGSVDDVVKVTYYLVDAQPTRVAEFEAGFGLAAKDGVRLPLKAAATLAGVQALANPEWLIEIDAIAVIGD
jgi:enamine deaminase RidA (YjgF/YER057c/UK114 family)